MRYVIALCLATSLLFLTACEVPVSECSWSRQIEFEDETKEWLKGLEWPQSAYEDFDEIGDHNELHGRYCK